jgi:hypothetical protein
LRLGEHLQLKLKMNLRSLCAFLLPVFWTFGAKRRPSKFWLRAGIAALLLRALMSRGWCSQVV